jgi:hypothetical protein
LAHLYRVKLLSVSDINQPTEKEIQLQQGDRVIGGSMIFVAIRCTIQYIVLPFILPLFGLGNTVSVVLSTILEVVALVTIIYNLVRLWNTSWRWRYLGLSAVMGGLIAVFLYFDIIHLMGAA